MSTVSRKDPFLISTLVIAALLMSSFASMALIPNIVIQSTERVVSKDNVILQTASATSEGGGETGGGETGGGETGGGETGGGETGGGETGGGETGGGETGGGETGGGETGGGETGGGDLSQGNGLPTPTPAPTQGFEGFPLTPTPTPLPTQGFEGFPLTPTPGTNGFPLTPTPDSEDLPTPESTPAPTGIPGLFGFIPYHSRSCNSNSYSRSCNSNQTLHSQHQGLNSDGNIHLTSIIGGAICNLFPNLYLNANLLDVPCLGEILYPDFDIPNLPQCQVTDTISNPNPSPTPTQVHHHHQPNTITNTNTKPSPSPTQVHLHHQPKSITISNPTQPHLQHLLS